LPVSAPRVIDRPEPGYWLVRLIKDGPWVPAAIVRVQTMHEPGEPDNLMERSPFLAAEIAGDTVAVDEVWQRRGQPITADEYVQRVAQIKWARQHAPHDPIANPRERIDPLTAPLPF
jgi:hypothetical protein